jgi:hypothetical protein
MEQRHHLRLELGLQIDQEIAAGDQIEAGERGACRRFCGANVTASRSSCAIR